MGGEDINRVDPESVLARRVDARGGYNNLNSPEARSIFDELDALVNEHNEFLKFFKSTHARIANYNVINPDKTPPREQVRQCNAHVVDDFAGISVGATNCDSKKKQ